MKIFNLECCQFINSSYPGNMFFFCIGPTSMLLETLLVNINQPQSHTPFLVANIATWHPARLHHLITVKAGSNRDLTCQAAAATHTSRQRKTLPRLAIPRDTKMWMQTNRHRWLMQTMGCTIIPTTFIHIYCNLVRIAHWTPKVFCDSEM